MLLTEIYIKCSPLQMHSSLLSSTQKKTAKWTDWKFVRACAHTHNLLQNLLGYTYSKKCTLYSGKFVAYLGYVPLNISQSACQRCTNTDFPKIYESPQILGARRVTLNMFTLMTQKYQAPPQKIQSPWWLSAQDLCIPAVYTHTRIGK
jgi:hypothetical protein